ncbi:threonine/serine exporter [Puteibacter caeruleilacunae]|nr:threonine/serine exporter [Puteibacter caeruleilacunae]
MINGNTYQATPPLQAHNSKELVLKEQSLFLSEYASTLMGSGVHTSRVIRNTKRIGKALGLEVTVSGLHKSLILSVVADHTGDSFSTMVEIPHSPISFEINTNLSRLSWEAHDEQLSFHEIVKRFTGLVSRPKLHPIVVLILSSFANASFCALFGGDCFAMGIVFSATLIGMFTKQQMLAKDINLFLSFITSAFIASLAASTSVIFNTTSDIAIATSVLFLIPGVPLINGFMDIMEGHVITGTARLINALLLVLCIAIGMSGTIMLTKHISI